MHSSCPSSSSTLLLPPMLADTHSSQLLRLLVQLRGSKGSIEPSKEGSDLLLACVDSFVPQEIADGCKGELQTLHCLSRGLAHTCSGHSKVLLCCALAHFLVIAGAQHLM